MSILTIKIFKLIMLQIRWQLFYTQTNILDWVRYFRNSTVPSVDSFYVYYRLNIISSIFQWLQYHPCDLFLRVGQESNQTHVSTYQKWEVLLLSKSISYICAMNLVSMATCPACNVRSSDLPSFWEGKNSRAFPFSGRTWMPRSLKNVAPPDLTSFR